jgi:hypothetical protein
MDSSIFSTKVSQFFADYWNGFEFLAIVGFTVGLIIRSVSTEKCENCFKVAR